MRIHILNSSDDTTTITSMKNRKILNLINDKKNDNARKNLNFIDHYKLTK